MEDSNLKGIKGWLLIVLIGLIVSIISVAVSLNDSMPLFKPDAWHAITTYGSEAYHPLFGPWVIYEALFNVFIIIFSICLLFMMFRKSHRFPKFMIFYFISAVFLQGIDYILSYKVLTDLPKVSETLNVYPSLDGVMRALVQTAVWVPYFIKSKRVKATFLSESPKIILEKGPLDKDL
ncbi:MAG: DUF2569 domain-containing protein [Bacillota bacterium]|nr:DUF2569 domain-containing protein [Bacillota bacterium]